MARTDPRNAALRAATVRQHLAFWQLACAIRHQPEITRAVGPALTTWTDEIIGVLSTLLRVAGATEPEVSTAYKNRSGTPGCSCRVASA